MARKTNKPADEQQKPFDPWTATEQEALGAENEFGRRGYHPYFDWCAAQRINELKPKIEKASEVIQHGQAVTLKDSALVSETGLDILNSLAVILKKHLLTPRWLTDAFLQRVNPVILGKADTWDSEKCFGKPKTLKKAKEKADREQTKLHVRHFIRKLWKENPGIKIYPKNKQKGLIWLLMEEVNALNKENNMPIYSLGEIKTLYYEVTNKYPERYSDLTDVKLRGRRGL